MYVDGFFLHPNNTVAVMADGLFSPLQSVPSD